ncbi:nacht domain protein [Diplodia corticola]|uniref:Nacht domain protein n=1 Tax=Diplodia corticola TaxID=236234 RepID=A0A1J9QVW5_9PEZI|nr:nacht domain protein [Diplodia corticola]OJD32560.1 nacht domain protein [Diplodia corticola]
MDDVQRIVHHTQAEYDKRGRGRKRVLQWLHSFSIRIAHYERVLDALAQHHPEYVSLAWGALKLVFTYAKGIINHHELVEKLAEALASIGDILAQVKLTAELYQTERMGQAIAQLYVCIIKFFVKVIIWYKHGSGTRMVLSIFNPFDVSFKNTLEQLRDVTDTINNLANQANQAEVRDIHGIVREVNGKLHDVQGRVQDMRDTIQDAHGTIKDVKGEVDGMKLCLQMLMDKFGQNMVGCEYYRDAVAKAVDARMYLASKPLLNVRDGERFGQSVLSQLKTSLDPERNLHKQQVLIKNRQKKPGYVFDVGSVLAALNQWSSCPNSSLLVLQSAPRANVAAKSLCVQLITQIRIHHDNVFYILSQPGSEKYEPSMENILKSLVAQAIGRDSKILPSLHDGFNFDKVIASHSEGEWLELLGRILCKIGMSVIIVESEDLYRLNGGDEAWRLRFLSTFKQLTQYVEAAGATLKTLVLSFGASAQQVVATLGSGPNILQATVHRASPLPPRLKRSAAARSEKQRKSLRALELKL